MAGAAGGEPLCGCRSSGNLGVGVREHGRRSWGVLRTPEITVSTSVGSDTSWGGCGHGHAMAGGERFSGKVVGLAREGGGARGEGESGRGLTAVLLVLLARQGRHGVRRIDGGDHRHPRSETAALEMQQSFWRRVTRWRGRRRRGGARDHVGEVGQWLWVRGYGSASMEASAMAGNGRGEA